jgi:hypothetical protein
MWIRDRELVTFKERGKDTGGQFALVEVVGLPGSGPPPHIHHRVDEVYCLLEGELEVLDGEVEQSTRADTSTDPSLEYQYFWWVDTPDGKNHFSARGKYGQYIYVAPEKGLVIVRLGKVEGEQGYGYWIGLFEKLATKLDTSAKKSR